MAKKATSDYEKLIAELNEGLKYCGDVTSIKQRYFVFESATHYFLLSFRPHDPSSGNFSCTTKNSVDWVYKRWKGYERVSAAGVVEDAKKTRRVPDKHIALDILYVLTALSRAEIEGYFEHKELYFSVGPVEILADSSTKIEPLPELLDKRTRKKKTTRKRKEHQ